MVKTIENLRKRINVRFVNNEKDYLKYTSRPTYVTHKLFNKYFAAIHEIKLVLVLNKPVYIGFTVLDLSKWLMYDFHYNFIKKDFSAKLLFTDTDTLTLKDSAFYDDTNKKVTGKMKDEYGGAIIDQFIGLKSKMYSIKKINGS